ncbi:GTP cyclohydrolase N terminal-domain-containing protein [Piptocephalis cylindrospora]|uniref:GTP cyclohydrolase N terminal-domain-containing protein n=1 Tax=Piptocephalis cylindrospora TaxID=1907219 RepID=A0A4P9Y4S7_9FUNG|nr:GTP cyclohydrolase N terminal-domain-containing protein [Piptocephalis cylindrospora]|eukprot:RKP13161.1 GTP cyclohydrolase N terminal-domain-containing protein [Piptocephalis cylindrospora]
MDSTIIAPKPSTDTLLSNILAALISIQEDQTKLRSQVEEYQRATSTEDTVEDKIAAASSATSTHLSQSQQYSDRIILTTYPGQMGIKPIPLHWGVTDPLTRGPVVVSRHPSSIKRRNAIGAYGGSYCVYRALSIAIGALPANHIPDYGLTAPPVSFPPQPSWTGKAIVSMDPWGHMVPQLWGKEIQEEKMDLRPSIAITKAHMTIPEIEGAVQAGRLKVDGNVVLNAQGELKVTKAAIEPVWYLPGVAERFGITEGVLRRALFEDTGGMYPELITRPDLKVFLPPIGGATVYIFGDPSTIPDTTVPLTSRVHDECNGSDVFGSDICTCRPYLIYGIEECVRQAQEGGNGVIVYFRKEGRALGEVTKYLVYNARKRQEGGDTADNYFLRTENVAGVKDARFQALMPDILSWLGIKKIDRFMSMSNMKYEAIADANIEVVERCPIPDELIPADSRVEIDAKIAAGYFTSGQVPTEKGLADVKGRGWDDIQH